MSALDRFRVPDLRPLVVYAFLIGSICYCLYQSAPQFGMKRIKGRVAAQTCVGNTAPFGCRLEVEFSENNTVQQRTFTGAFKAPFSTFQEVDVYLDPKDVNNCSLENSWSSEGLVLSGILLFLLWLYHTLRK